MRTLPCLLVLGLALGACAAYDSDIGPTPYLCSDTMPECPEGYSCKDDISTGERVCVGNGGMLSNNFDCTDDSALEPNNMLDTALATELDTMKTFSKDGLSICPAGDRDVFALTIGTQNENVQLDVEFQGNGAVLVGQILNAGGIPISTAELVTGETTKIRANAQNLPAGKYYAQVAASVSETLTLNNFKIALTVSGP